MLKALLLGLFALFLLTGSKLPSPAQTANANVHAATAEKTYCCGPPSPVGKGAPESADDRIADYTLWLTLFTGVLGAVGFAQGYLLWQQGALARDEFNSTHRPKLHVRRILFMGYSLDYPDAVKMNGRDFMCEITFANVGESPCIIIESRYHLTFYRDSTPVRYDFPDSASAIMPTGTMIVPGTHLVTRIDSTRIIPGRNPGYEAMFDLGIWRPVIFGEVVYTSSGNDTARRTLGFVRELDLRDDRFVRVDAPEYEYED